MVLKPPTAISRISHSWGKTQLNSKSKQSLEAFCLEGQHSTFQRTPFEFLGKHFLLWTVTKASSLGFKTLKSYCFTNVIAGLSEELRQFNNSSPSHQLPSKRIALCWWNMQTLPGWVERVRVFSEVKCTVQIQTRCWNTINQAVKGSRSYCAWYWLLPSKETQMLWLISLWMAEWWKMQRNPLQIQSSPTYIQPTPTEIQLCRCIQWICIAARWINSSFTPDNHYTVHPPRGLQAIFNFATNLLTPARTQQTF